MRNRILILASLILLSLTISTSSALAVINIGEDGEQFSEFGEVFNEGLDPSDLPNEYYQETSADAQRFLELINLQKDVIEEYDQGQWEAIEGETEATAECLGRPGTADDCVNEIEDGDTRMPRGTPPSEIQDGADVVETARDYGTNLDPEISDNLDLLGEESGTLDAGAIDLAGEAIAGNLLLVPGAFTLGVAIGNGLDQLFGLPEWKWGSEKEPDEQARDRSRENESSEVKLRFVKAGNGGFENVPPFSGISLEGAGCDGGFYCSIASADSAAARLDVKVRLFNESGAELNPAEDGTTLIFAMLCEAESAFASCQAPPAAYDEHGEAKAGGIPVPNSKSIEEENERYNSAVKTQEADGAPGGNKVIAPLPTSPEAPAAPHLPTKTSKRGAVVPKTVPGTIIINQPTREIITTTKGTPEEIATEEKERAKKLLPEPRPGETAEQYKNRLEELGFTDVDINELTELNEDPDVGPEVVTKVNPSPGDEVAADEKVTVDENPKDAPTAPGEKGSKPGESSEGGPGGEGGGGVGGPTEPGFKLPDFAILCKGFPFGVPCWLAQTVESWSATGKAPELGIEEFEIEHTKIPSGKFDLVHLEPEMEYIRPAMIIFATIGLVLLFFSFAKGGGPPSGSTGDNGGDSYNVPDGE